MSVAALLTLGLGIVASTPGCDGVDATENVNGCSDCALGLTFIPSTKRCTGCTEDGTPITKVSAPFLNPPAEFCQTCVAGDGVKSGTIVCDADHGTVGGVTGSCTCTCDKWWGGEDCASPEPTLDCVGYFSELLAADNTNVYWTKDAWSSDKTYGTRKCPTAQAYAFNNGVDCCSVDPGAADANTCSGEGVSAPCPSFDGSPTSVCVDNTETPPAITDDWLAHTETPAKMPATIKIAEATTVKFTITAEAGDVLYFQTSPSQGYENWRLYSTVGDTDTLQTGWWSGGDYNFASSGLDDRGADKGSHNHFVELSAGENAFKFVSWDSSDSYDDGGAHGFILNNRYKIYKLGGLNCDGVVLLSLPVAKMLDPYCATEWMEDELTLKTGLVRTPPRGNVPVSADVKVCVHDKGIYLKPSSDEIALLKEMRDPVMRFYFVSHPSYETRFKLYCKNSATPEISGRVWPYPIFEFSADYNSAKQANQFGLMVSLKDYLGGDKNCDEFVVDTEFKAQWIQYVTVMDGGTPLKNPFKPLISKYLYDDDVTWSSAWYEIECEQNLEDQVNDPVPNGGSADISVNFQTAISTCTNNYRDESATNGDELKFLSYDNVGAVCLYDNQMYKQAKWTKYCGATDLDNSVNQKETTLVAACSSDSGCETLARKIAMREGASDYFDGNTDVSLTFPLPPGATLMTGNIFMYMYLFDWESDHSSDIKIEFMDGADAVKETMTIYLQYASPDVFGFYDIGVSVTAAKLAASTKVKLTFSRASGVFGSTNEDLYWFSYSLQPYITFEGTMGSVSPTASPTSSPTSSPTTSPTAPTMKPTLSPSRPGDPPPGPDTHVVSTLASLPDILTAEEQETLKTSYCDTVKELAGSNLEVVCTIKEVFGRRVLLQDEAVPTTYQLKAMCTVKDVTVNVATIETTSVINAFRNSQAIKDVNGGQPLAEDKISARFSIVEGTRNPTAAPTKKPVDARKWLPDNTTTTTAKKTYSAAAATHSISAMFLLCAWLY